MSDSGDIYKEDIILGIRESGKLYTPFDHKIDFIDDGVQYKIIVSEPDAPGGASLQAVKNVNAIAWDEAFYLEWDRTSFADSYNVILEDASGNIVAKAENYNEPIDEQEPQDSETSTTLLKEAGFPVNNGNTYTAYVESVIGEQVLKSVEVTGDVGIRTPQNLVLVNVTATTANLNWDDVVLSFDRYKVYVKHISSGDIVQAIDGIQLSEVDLSGLTDGEEYEVWVTAISEKSIFESAESNHITFIPTACDLSIDDITIEEVTTSIGLIVGDTNHTTATDTYDILVNYGWGNVDIIDEDDVANDVVSLDSYSAIVTCNITDNDTLTDTLSTKLKTFLNQSKPILLGSDNVGTGDSETSLSVKMGVHNGLSRFDDTRVFDIVTDTYNLSIGTPNNVSFNNAGIVIEDRRTNEFSAGVKVITRTSYYSLSNAFFPNDSNIYDESFPVRWAWASFIQEDYTSTGITVINEILEWVLNER